MPVGLMNAPRIRSWPRSERPRWPVPHSRDQFACSPPGSARRVLMNSPGSACRQGLKETLMKTCRALHRGCTDIPGAPGQPDEPSSETVRLRSANGLASPGAGHRCTLSATGRGTPCRWPCAAGNEPEPAGASATGVLAFREPLAQPLDFLPGPRRVQLPAARLCQMRLLGPLWPLRAARGCLPSSPVRRRAGPAARSWVWASQAASRRSAPRSRVSSCSAKDSRTN